MIVFLKKAKKKRTVSKKKKRPQSNPDYSDLREREGKHEAALKAEFGEIIPGESTSSTPEPENLLARIASEPLRNNKASLFVSIFNSCLLFPCGNPFSSKSICRRKAAGRWWPLLGFILIP